VTTLASGPTLQTKYGKLGGFTGTMVAPAERITAFIHGVPGCGKSAFLQSHPDAFIFNFDNSSTVTPTAKAAIWPGRDPDSGRPIGDDGQPFVLNWPAAQAKINLLKELAVNNQPRPSTVVFDSISAWVQLLVAWVPANAVSLYLRSAEKGPVDSWRALDGKAAWTAVYDLIYAAIAELQNCGYGVYVIGHVVQKAVPIDEDLYNIRYDLALGDGLWRRIFPLFELCATVTTSLETRPVTTQRTVKNRDGSVRTYDSTTDETFKAFRLTYEMKGMEGISKSRVRFPPVTLPEHDAWAHFARIYNENRSKGVPVPPAPAV